MVDVSQASVIMKDPRGKLVQLPAENAQRALQAGFSYETDEERTKRERIEEYGGVGGTIAAGALGAARGATFGLSDVALRGLGVSPETLSAYKEVNPEASLTGEIGGAVLPLLFTGGAAAPATGARLAVAGGRAAQAARIAGTGVRTVARAGMAVERGAGALLGLENATNIGRLVASKALAKGAGAAVEGTIYGGGQVLSELALGRPDMTGDKILAHVGMATLMAGGIGGVLGAASGAGPRAVAKGLQATKAARQAVGKAGSAVSEGVSKTYVRAAAGAVEATGSEATEQAAYRAAKDAMGEAIDAGPGARVTGQAADAAAEKMAGQADDILKEAGSGDIVDAAMNYRKRVLAGVEDREKVAGDLQQSLNDMHETVDGLTAKVTANQKPKAIETIIKRDNIQAQPALDDLRAHTAYAKQIVAEMRERPSLYKSAIAADIEDAVTVLENDLISAGDDAYKVFQGVEKARKRLDLANKFGKPLDTSVEASKSYQLLDDVTAKFRSHLTNKSIYGAAGAQQASYNTALSRYLSVRKLMIKKFGEKGVKMVEETIDGGTVKKALPREVDIISPTKLNTYLNQITSARGAQRDLILREYIDASEDVLRQVDDIAKLGGEVDLTGARGLIKNVAQRRDAAAEALGDIAKLRALDVGLGFYEATQSGALGRIGSIAFSPTATVRKLANLERMLGDVGKRFDSGIDRMIAGLEKGTARVSGAVEAQGARLTEEIRGGVGQVAEEIRGATGRVVEAIRPPKRPGPGYAGTRTPSRLVAPITVLGNLRFTPPEDREKEPRKGRTEYDRLFGELATLAASPELLSKRATEAVGGLEFAAPRTMAHMVGKLMQGVQFAYDKAPKPPIYTDTVVATKPRGWQPPAAELNKWAKYLTAIARPMDVIDNITPEGVDVLRNVYGSLYEALTMAIVKRYDEIKDNASKDVRVKLSILFGIPFDETLRPEFIQMAQSMFGADLNPPEGQQTTAVRPTATGLSKLDIADRAATGTEKLLSR